MQANCHRRLRSLAVIAFALAIAPPAAFAQAAQKPAVIKIVNADGTGLQQLFDLPGFGALGSPAFSPDGKRLAFDGWQSEMGEGTSDARLFVLTLDTRALVEVGRGAMPTWSSDGRFLACSRYSPVSGVFIVSDDGKDEERIEAGGWGAQWSPDGKSVAYTRGTQIVIYDVVTGQARDLAFPAPLPYTQIYWNATWSPDSERLCFLGLKADNTRDLATVRVNRPEDGIKVHVSSPHLNADAAWHPEGKRLVFIDRSEELKRQQLFEINPDSDAPPKLFEGQDPAAVNVGPCWSPDGAYLVFISRGP
jgi:Tol biopolymer transport system component